MKATILAVVVLAFSVNQAFAVSLAVKIACRDDYFAHCSMHAVGSQNLRKCMRDVGPRLSKQCIGALAAAGEIKKERAAYKKKYYAKKPVAKKQYAYKSSTKKRYAENTIKKSYDKKQTVKKKYVKRQYVKKPYARKQYARRELARG